MEITKEIKEVSKELSNVYPDFLEFVEMNPACFERSNFKELDELRRKYHLLQPWPTFLSNEKKEIFRDAGIKLCNLIKAIPKRLFNNDIGKMSDFYALPKQVLALQTEGITKAHLDNLIARGDFILSASGLKCLEYNIAGNLGGWKLPLWESLYLKNPLILQFLKEYGVEIKNKNSIEVFLEHCIQSAEGLVSLAGDNEINVAMVIKSNDGKDPDGIYGYLDRLMKELLKAKHTSLSGNVFGCDYKHLEVKDDWVYYNGKRIHVLTENYKGLVPPPIFKVFMSGHIRIMNGPVTGLLSSKLNLALLSEHEDSDIFDDEEREAIKKYVPWSRRLVAGETLYGEKKIQLEDFVLSNKDNLVIKPSLGFGGDGVYIGRNVTVIEWEALVKTALRRKDYLVQELVESISPLYQYGESGTARYDMAWGFFIFGSRYGGTFLRVIPKKNGPSVINTHQGAQISAVFDVAD